MTRKTEELEKAIVDLIDEKKLMSFTARELAEELGVPVAEVSSALQMIAYHFGTVHCGGGNTWTVRTDARIYAAAPKETPAPVQSKPPVIYQAADGTRWRPMTDQVTGREVYDEIGNDDAFRPQKLWEVITYHGALSLYDPVAESAQLLAKAMLGTKLWDRSRSESHAHIIVKELHQMGYGVRKLEDDDH